MRALYVLAGVAGMYLPTYAMAQVSLETLRTCFAIEDPNQGTPGLLRRQDKA